MTSTWDFLFGGAFLALIVAVALYTRAVPAAGRRWWAMLLLLAVVVLGATFARGGLVRMLWLDAAAFTAVALVWIQGTPEARGAARVYLALVVVAMACIGAGLWAGGLFSDSAATAPAPPFDRLALGLLVAGFGLKLALVPLYFWLPNVAACAAPMTTALIVAVVDIAAFSELAHLRLEAPWLFGPGNPLWLGVALLSMLGGALLALAQHDMKRMLAFSTIDDMGYLLLGVVAGPGPGLTGALAGALSHSLCKVLLFGAVGVAEQQDGRAVDLDSPGSRGLLARYPVSGIAFIVGALCMIGIPPLFGFAGRWRLYLAGIQLAGGAAWLAAVMMLSTGIALLYYVRALHRVWFGPLPASVTALKREPRLAAGVLAVLTVAGMVLGLFPGLIMAWLP